MDKLYSLIANYYMQTGEFTLSGGAKSNVYFDIKSALVHPKCAELIHRKLYRLEEFCIDFADGMVAGIETGAIPLLQSFILLDKIPALIVRKDREHGLKKSIIGINNISSVRKIIIIEDVVTSGKSVIQAYETLREVGLLNIIGVICVIDREEGGKENILEQTGLGLQSIYKKEDFLDETNNI